MYRELYVVDGTVSSLPQRNFHGVDHPNVPINGVFRIEIKYPSSPTDEETFKAGNVVLLPNVRAKNYKGEMELIWSERLTDEQEARGWKVKSATLIQPEDERALAIER